MNWLKKRLSEHSNPVNFTLHVIGIILGIYGLWIHNMAFIITGIIILPSIGSIYAYLGENKIKLLILNHEHPINLATHIAGFFIGIYGLWMHNFSLIVIAFALMVLGHIITWK